MDCDDCQDPIMDLHHYWSGHAILECCSWHKTGAMHSGVNPLTQMIAATTPYQVNLKSAQNRIIHDTRKQVKLLYPWKITGWTCTAVLLRLHQHCHLHRSIEVRRRRVPPLPAIPLVALWELHQRLNKLAICQRARPREKFYVIMLIPANEPKETADATAAASPTAIDLTIGVST